MQVLGSVLGWILLAVQPQRGDFMEGNNIVILIKYIFSSFLRTYVDNVFNLENLFDDHASGELVASTTTNHVVGCNIGQIHQRAGYKDITPSLMHITVY